jgi:hypothetical protein
MGFAEALSDDGSSPGAAALAARGFCGVMTALGGLGHSLPYLIPDFKWATALPCAWCWSSWRDLVDPPPLHGHAAGLPRCCKWCSAACWFSWRESLSATPDMGADRQKSWTAITYAQDFSGEGAGLGPQTVLRLNAIAKARADGYHLKAIVLAGGIGPETKKYPHQTRPLATMMKDWLVTEGKFPAEMIYTSAEAWNCITVTLEMIRLIKENNLPRNVLVVSTGGHIYPRMWTTWVLLCGGKKDWSLGFLPAWEGTYDLLHELGGTVKYIPMSLWYRAKI